MAGLWFAGAGMVIVVIARFGRIEGIKEGFYEWIPAVQFNESRTPLWGHTRLACGHSAWRVVTECVEVLRSRPQYLGPWQAGAMHRRGLIVAVLYPAARRSDVGEDLFGFPVADPYRWLEDGQYALEWD